MKPLPSSFQKGLYPAEDLNPPEICKKIVKSLEIRRLADSLRAPWLALQEKPKPGKRSLNALK